ncbi:mediator of RNA polymerase II transcription subunit 26 isoform X2 [Drosophila willistoni]|uniref:mediator of RNA polymerase II transcription subunit 26 isoform X2 n=1 Tax=Drosophila willistoni TaxID=7260 RepID=UPI00017D9362|nr:mediator of RNA polymerase II transcription subunit 26 isoform X2 [Drosophila willistoni]
MNQNQIQQLTSHLSQALDQNYDVVNLEAVLSVICALEGTTITKEQLEATRLAKYINHLRRRTKNEQLARRAKSLLKRWREMVGIQQTATDSQPAPSQPLTAGESAVVVVPSQQSSSPLAPPQLPINLQKNFVDVSLEQQQPLALPTVTVPSSHHTNFSNLINNIASKSDESKPFKFQRESGPIIDHSSNSVSNSTAADRFTDAAIVIDIVSDSNDNDGVVGGGLSVPANVPARNKKLKKDKRRRERESQRPKATLLNRNEVMGQQSRYATKINCAPYKDGKAQAVIPTDAEILSLSNSSMSSILSGDVTVGNSHSKSMPPRPNNTSELTFAGRFKSVSQPESAVLNGHQFRGTEHLAPITFDDSITNDSNISFSRLSPTPTPSLFPFEERRKALEEAGKQQIEISVLVPPSTTTSSLGNEQSNRSNDFIEGGAASRGILPQIPKKRGRKKGSKGVDSLIAKESSSLSQQIFFGSGVKKVKTTKELFNELQSRKLSNVVQSVNNLSNASSDRDREEALSSRSLQPRPTSSCSEASMHSPQILDTYSSNITLMDADKFSNQNEDIGNTDSDTITSEPSRDSQKSRGNKATSSLESNSNSLQTPSATTGFPNQTHNDVTTQLMHVVHSLGSPPSVGDTEKMYQSQIVPCTCIVVEEEVDPSAEQTISADRLDSEKVTPTGPDSNVLPRDDEAQGDSIQKLERNVADDKTVLPAPQKPIKSIFDLDFDEDDDPLQSIIRDLRPPTVDLEAANGDVKSMMTTSANVITATSGITDGAPVHTDGMDLDQDAAEATLVPLPIFTVHEDPDCMAKERFLVQTNKVTNFHINALHNYCVPNINGNWDGVETASESISSLELYAVTDGADVVPKYGSLTCERIPKDLSGLKFARSISRIKTFKSYLPPFLGVAKCLPTCRRANRQRRRFKESKMQPKSPEISCKLEESESELPFLQLKNENVSIISKSSPSPLQVDVNVGDNIEVVTNFDEGSIDDEIHNNSSFRGPSENENSYNLLKLANDDDLPLEVGANGEMEFRENSRCSSSCSNSSLIKTQQTINAKLRSQQITDQYVIERNRKKRRKTREKEQKPRIKRIKIAINGKVTSQRQISNISSSNNSSDNEDKERGSDTLSLSDDINASQTHSPASNEDEHDDSFQSGTTTFDSIVADEDVDGDGDADGDGDGVLENDYENSDDEEYAIVQRPVACGTSSNHIVLTIKKTPSKINSPNSISAVSPITGSEIVPGSAKKSYFINMIDPNTKPAVQSSSKENEAIVEAEPQLSLENAKPENIIDNRSLLSSQTYCIGSYRRRLHRLRRRRLRIEKSAKLRNTIDIELNHLFISNAERSAPLSETRLHRKLFYNDELCRQNNLGEKERILDYSSSSSSSDNSDIPSDSDEEDNSSSTNEADNIQVAKHKTNIINIETDIKASASKDAAKQEDEEPCESSSDNDNGDDDDFVKEDFANLDTNIEIDTVNNLPLHNNGLLPSFNSICAENPPRSMLPSAALTDEPETNPKPQIASLKSLQNENCDDVNNLYYNNNNLDVIKNSLVPSPILNDSIRESVTSNISSIILASDNKSSIQTNSPGITELIRPDCQTGIRAVAASDKLTSAKEDSRSSQVHQFKEWHQVLQLPSYNDEPLIVLPYVVLE